MLLEKGMFGSGTRGRRLNDILWINQSRLAGFNVPKRNGNIIIVYIKLMSFCHTVHGDTIKAWFNDLDC